jgi:hypothetical protein
MGLADSVCQLGDAAIALAERGAFADARSVLELLIASGAAPQPLLALYAVCLSELGEDERAARALEMAGSLENDDPRSERLSNQAREWVLGPRSRKSRERMRGEAEKWLPRAPRQST